MGHTDVVGVERDKWTVDPFAGVIKDGYLWGRGSSDDKDSVAANLEVLLLLHRQKIPLDRDVIFLAEAGEEGTSQVGIGFMVAQHWDKIDSEFALAEGGTAAVRDGKVRYVAIAATEKVGRGARLVARGTSGHGSIPRPDNAIVHLSAAVAKAGQYQSPMKLNDITRTFFQRMATISAPDEAFLLRTSTIPSSALWSRRFSATRGFRYNSMLRTSISPTIIKGELPEQCHSRRGRGQPRHQGRAGRGHGPVLRRAEARHRRPGGRDCPRQRQPARAAAVAPRHRGVSRPSRRPRRRSFPAR